MSLTNSSPPVEVARVFIAECLRRGYTREMIIPRLSTLIQESDLQMIWDPSKRWFGYAQQDGSYPNRMDPMGNLLGFLDRLEVQERKPGASSDPWLNIFWLQQGPNHKSAEYGYSVGRKEYLTEIKSKVAQADRYYEQYMAKDPFNPGGSVTVKGDPLWLEEVLRADLGDRLIVHKDWDKRGTGGVMGTIWGTMIHHTGNVNETVKNIRDGVQQPGGFLPGPLSQGLITPDGMFNLISVGPCNHAGSGNWKDLTNGNRDSIGFECAYSGSGPWPQKQIITMRDAAAAISRYIGKPASTSVCGHKEYAKPQGRKPDPGNMDMDWFRGEVQKDLDGFVFPGEDLVTPPPVKPVDPTPPPYTTPPNHTELMYDQLNGRWEMLGYQTIVETLAELRDAVTGSHDVGKRGFTRGPRIEGK